MRKNLLQIDVSNTKSKEDLLTIQFQDEDTLHVNFSKLIGHSKYIRDKYKYSEALDSIQSEIEEIETKYNINEESIKLFIQLIQEDKINVPLEHYKDIYTLSEYFCIPKFISVLDNISKKELFQDLDFTIQFLLDSEKSENGLETKLICKIENFLIERINECIKNEKFGELPVPTIYRIVDQSKEKVDHDLLVDFIFESVDTHFILLKFVELDKLKDEKVEKLIKFVDDQDESTKNMCLEYIPFNLSFIKNILNKKDLFYNKMNKTEQELNQTKQDLNQTKQDLNQTKQDLDQTKQELNQTKQELNQTKQDLSQTKQDLSQTKQELNQTKQDLNQTKQELNQTKQDLNQTEQDLNQTEQDLNQTKQDLNQTKQELNQTKQDLDQTKQDLSQTKQDLSQTKQELNQTKQDLSQTEQKYNEAEIKENQNEFKQVKNEFSQIKSEIKQYIQSIFVGGHDKYCELGEKPNNKNKDGYPIISPPMNLPFDPSSLLSYSSHSYHSVLVMNDGSLKGIGFNKDGRISSTLQKTAIDDFTDFYIKDGSGRQLAAVSAVCCQCSTLYMFSKSSSNERQLVLCDCEINGGDPVFLDIGNHHPVSLFGGYYHSAAIGSEGEVIFINRNSVKKSPNSPIEAVSLPDGEKASSVACCDDTVVVLSSNGRVFTSPIEEGSSVLNFSIVLELPGQEIIGVSGTRNHFLAVSKEGRVFGLGSNSSGKLGLGKGIESVSSFTEISSLVGCEIRAAYAGFGHSLFETREGKILSCGYNNNGELLLSNGPGKSVYSPTETTITNSATFCIAGANHSIVFIGTVPPSNTPNIPIHQQH